MNVRLIALACLPGALATGMLFAETPANGSAPASKMEAAPRSLTAIRADVSAALRAEASTRRSGNNRPEVLRLVDLYREMAGHPQHSTSAVLQEMGLQVRARLRTVHDRIDRKLSDANRTSKNQKVPRGPALPETRVLAQQLPPPGAGVVGQGAVVGGFQRTATTTVDFGPELVALIEATISPATWNINGGNGAIVYYAPLHVLVVSAPDDVHAQMGNVMGQLRVAQQQIDGVQVVAEVAAVGAHN